MKRISGCSLKIANGDWLRLAILAWNFADIDWFAVMIEASYRQA